MNNSVVKIQTPITDIGVIKNKIDNKIGLVIETISSVIELANNVETIDYSKLQVLFVDDLTVNQKIGKKVLTMIGFRKENIVIVNNGKIAVETIKKNHFDIVLMDRMMPIMGGDDATNEIKKLKSNIIIISVTATPEGAKYQPYDYILTKPLKKNNLLNALQTISLKKPLN